MEVNGSEIRREGLAFPSRTASPVKRRPAVLGCLAFVCLTVLFILPSSLFADVPKGPDNQPLPGTQGGLAIPKERSLKQPELAPFKGLFDAAEKDKKEHQNAKSGSIEGTLPGGRKVPVKWERVDEQHCKCSVILTETVTLVFEFAHDAQGVTHLKAALPDLPTQERHVGPNYIFVGTAPDCTDLIWVQYIERKDTLFDTNGVALGTNKLGPGIDGGVPYPVQSSVNGSTMAQDSPGSFGPAGVNDQQFANGEIQSLRKQLNLPNDKAGTKAKREFKFWTYLICSAPSYKVIGHFEWSFTINIDVQKAPFMGMSDVKEPTWTAGS
jgi:hypothetical protein